MLSPETRGPRSFLVEGFVIVASILLAFGIDAWWDTAREARERDELLDQLEAELAFVRDFVLPEAESHSSRIDLAALRLLERAHGGAVDVPLDTLHQDVTRIDNGFRFAAALPVVEILAGDGGFERLEDPRLRTALSNLVAFVSLVREFEGSEQTFIATELRPYLSRKYDLYGALQRDRYRYADLPASVHDTDASLLRILGDPHFSTLLVTREQTLSATRTFRSAVGRWADSAAVALDAR